MMVKSRMYFQDLGRILMCNIESLVIFLTPCVALLEADNGLNT